MGIIISARDQASQVFNKIGGAFGRLTRQTNRARAAQGRFAAGNKRSIRSLKDLHREISRVRKQMAMASTAMGAAVFLAGKRAVTGLIGLTDAAGKFKQGMASIGAVTKASTDEIKLLRDTAIEAGIKTQFSPDEAREGLLSLATAGQTATDATKTLIPVLDLAAGSLGQLGVAESAEAVVGTLNAYGKAVEEAGPTTDKLLRITQLTNFQARDFGIGLSKAAAAGATFDQSLNDVLITMGLLRNRNIDASSSATAFREVTRRVGADSRAQQAVLSAGVKIFDKLGKMRSVVDIMSDFADKTKKMTDKQRNARIAVAFGARGLLAFNAVQKASFTTMKDGEKVVFKGAAAIDELRKKMDAAGGTAKNFKNTLLDTFEGQKTLLSGTLATLAVVFGEPLTKVLKPIVGAVVKGLNALLKFFNSLPEPVKKALMGFASFAAILTTVVGGVILLKGVMSLLGFSFSSIIMIVGQMLIMGPALILLFGGLGIAAYAAFRAFQKNTGGVADTWEEMVRKVTLGFKALKEILFDGSLSKGMKKELGRFENEGVMRFIKGAELFIERVKRFWDGLKKGFESGVDALAESSSMKTLMRTMRNVFSAFTGDEMVDSQEALADWGRQGAETGKKLARLGEIALNAINRMVELGGQFSKFVGAMTADDVSKGIDSTIETFKGLWTTLKGIVEVLGWISSAVRLVVNLFQTAGAFMSETVAGLFGFAKMNVQTVNETLSGDFSGRALKEFSNTPIYEETVRQAGDTIRVLDPSSRIGLEAEDRAKADKDSLHRLLQARREAEQMRQRRATGGGDTSDIVALLEKLNDNIFEISKRPPPPLNVTLDAGQVANKTKEADSRDADRSLDRFDMVFG